MFSHEKTWFRLDSADTWITATLSLGGLGSFYSINVLVHVCIINRVHSSNHMCIYMYMYMYQERIKAPPPYVCVCMTMFIHDVHLYMYPVTFSVSFGQTLYTHASWDMAAVMGPKSA